MNSGRGISTGPPPPSPTAGMENVEMFAHTSRKSVLFYQPQSVALQDQRYPASFLFKQANSGKISISWGLFTSSPVCSTNSGLPAEKGGGGEGTAQRLLEQGDAWTDCELNGESQVSLRAFNGSFSLWRSSPVKWQSNPQVADGIAGEPSPGAR